jgi:hypothetical protein
VSRADVLSAFRRIQKSQRRMDSVVRKLEAEGEDDWEDELSGPRPEPEPPAPPPSLGPLEKRRSPLWGWWKRSR